VDGATIGGCNCQLHSKQPKYPFCHANEARVAFHKAVFSRNAFPPAIPLFGKHCVSELGLRWEAECVISNGHW